MQAPILITGAARSGTSLVAGIINLCGAYGGALQGPGAANRKGMFENLAIRTQVTRPLLAALGADPMGQHPLPDIDVAKVAIDRAEGIREAVEQIIRLQGYSGGPWFYKGPKMCLAWPVWHAAFPRAQWILVRRPDEDVIDSCMRTRFMRRYKTKEGWQRWLDYHRGRLLEMTHNRDINCLTVWSDRIVAQPQFGKLMVEAVGLDWNEEAVMDFIDPSMLHTAELVT